MTVEMLATVAQNACLPARPGKGTSAERERMPCAKDAAERALSIDPHLAHFRPIIEARYDYFLRMLRTIEESETSLDQFSRGYESMGLNVVPEGILYREWAPGAALAYLFGDFSNLVLIDENVTGH